MDVAGSSKLGRFGVVTGAARALDLKSWDDKIAGTLRWKILAEFNNEAVLDKETQIVWERSPDTTFLAWTAARTACSVKNVGGRKGWRLPLSGASEEARLARVNTENS
jgi:hypothetical protein